jgi:arsenate reductase (glutaredoxin)
MTITLYGIPNCDSVKKARQQLDERGVKYEFYDYKKLGVPEQRLRTWVSAKGWETVLNRKGTTWRGLSDSVKANVIDNESAIEVMLTNLSTIKRPIIESNDALIVGLDVAAIATI